MKQCTVCRAWNRPEDLFCASCGEPLPMDTAVKEPLFVRIKRVCGSPVFLVAAILYTLYTLITIGVTICEWIQSPGETYTLLLYLLREMDAGDLYIWLNEYRSTVLVVGLLTQFISLLPRLLAAIGFWTFYAACKKQGDEPIRTSGLSLVKVSPIISLIGVSFMILGVMLSLVGIIIALAATGQEVILIGLIAALVMLTAAILSLIYYIGVIRSISAVRTASTTGKRGGRVSMFAVVWNFILAITSLVLLIPSFVPIPGLGIRPVFGFYTGMNLIASLCISVFYILISVALLQYRTKIESDLVPLTPAVPVVPTIPTVPPVYPQQPYNAQPAQPVYPQQPYNAQPAQPVYPQQPYNAQPAQPVYQQPYNAQPAQPVYPQQPYYTQSVQQDTASFSANVTEMASVESTEDDSMFCE